MNLPPRFFFHTKSAKTDSFYTSTWQRANSKCGKVMGQHSCLPSLKRDQSHTVNRTSVHLIPAFSSSSPRPKLVAKCK